MSGSLTRKVLYLIPFLILAVLVGLLSAKRIAARNAEKAAITLAEPAPLPVRAVRAEVAPIRAYVFGQGTARAVRRDFLTFEGQGKVTYVKVKEDGETIRGGDRVRGPQTGQKLGELLASLDKRDHVEQTKVARSSLVESEQQVTVARARLEQAEAHQNLAQDTFERNRKLFELKAISSHDLEVSRTRLKTADSDVASARAALQAALSGVAAAQARVEQAKLPMERSSIYAPFDGILTYVNVRPGDYFAPNLVDTSSEEAALKTIPMVVIDPSQFEVTMELPPFEGILVEPGQPAVILTSAETIPSAMELESDAPPGQGILRARVFSVSPAISPGGRAIQIKVRTDGDTISLRDGMFVACWIVVAHKPRALVVPFDVFIYRENQPFVFVVDESAGRVEQRPVTEGISGLSLQEVLEGVETGDLLVTDGRYGLTHRAPVQVIEIVQGNRL